MPKMRMNCHSIGHWKKLFFHFSLRLLQHRGDDPISRQTVVSLMRLRTCASCWNYESSSDSNVDEWWWEKTQRLFAFVPDQPFPSSSSCFPFFRVAVQSKSLVECSSIRWRSFIKSNCHFSLLHPVKSMFVEESLFVITCILFRKPSKNTIIIGFQPEKCAHFMKDQISWSNIFATELTPSVLRGGLLRTDPRSTNKQLLWILLNKWLQKPLLCPPQW